MHAKTLSRVTRIALWRIMMSERTEISLAQVVSEHPEIVEILGSDTVGSLRVAYVGLFDRELLLAESACLSGMFRSGASCYYLVSEDGEKVTEVGVDPQKSWWQNLFDWLFLRNETVVDAVARCGQSNIEYILQYFPGWRREMPPSITIYPRWG